MVQLIDELLGAVDWQSLGAASGDASRVPDALRQLLRASNADEASAAYWLLDNEVVVQGRMYTSVAPLISIIGLAVFHAGANAVARHRLVELLTEFALGHAHEDVRDPVGCEGSVRYELGRLAGSLFALLDDPDPRIRRDAIEILRTVEGESARLMQVANVLLADVDPGVRTLATVLRAENLH
jgi:hypothetical protein